MNQTDLQNLSEMRLKEARDLMATGNPCGAYYLAGYAVECAIKACIAKQTRQGDFPDKKRAIDAFDHGLDKLITVAELRAAFDQRLALDRATPQKAFAKNWATVSAWNVETRYETHFSAQDAAEIIEAIENPQNGILIWLQQHW